jgi:hypothetical protein
MTAFVPHVAPWPLHPPLPGAARGPCTTNTESTSVGLKDLLNKGKCLIGLHQGEWLAASSTVCTFTRTCVRCAAQHSKIEHPWGDWDFVSDQRCDQRRTCSRCAQAEDRVTHSWNPAQYLKPDSCEQHQRCARCNVSQPAPVSHRFDAVRFVDADCCDRIQECSRCHADGKRLAADHSWTDWEHSNAQNAGVRVCKRCGNMQTRPLPNAVPANGQTGVRQFAFDVPVVTDDAVADMLKRAGVRTETATQLDTRLVGHWRHTEILGGGGMSMSTDTHLQLTANGEFERWSRSISSMGERRGPHYAGRWTTESDTLTLRYDDGDQWLRSYQVESAALLFPHEGVLRYWERVR